MSKFKAFAIHLGISLVIFLVILYIIIFHWYPVPFFHSDGGWQGIKIIAGVDLVLGPLLTLIVFKAGKPKLKLDMTIIGLVQASALAWGIWAVHHERPIATVFADGYFATVTRYEVSATGLGPQEMTRFGERPPYWIYSNLPTEEKDLRAVRLRSAQTAKPISLMTEYYAQLDASAIDSIKTASLDIEKLAQRNEHDTKEYERFIKRHSDSKYKLLYFGWRSRYAWEIIALQQDNLHYVGKLAIEPPDSNELEKFLIGKR